MDTRPPGSDKALIVERVSKRFGRFAALDDVSLRVAPGEFLALLGPSGSGKSTLLRVLAGLERPDRGQVEFGGRDFLALTPRERRVGMVFQHYALFRHMTVAQNVAYGLKVRPRKERPPKAEIRARVSRLLELVQLEGLGRRFPSQLSGGQRQRVALARALAIEPRLLLLDEPFGALDAKVRHELRRWLRGIHDETGVTTIFVTHDQEEAMDLADCVAVLNAGRIEQLDHPKTLQETPATAFVFSFLGQANSVPCRLVGDHARIDGLDMPAIVAPGAAAETTGWFRPHDADLAPEGAPGLPVVIHSVLDKGAVFRVEARDDEGRLYEAAFARGALPDAARTGARASLRPRRLFLFPPGR